MLTKEFTKLVEKHNLDTRKAVLMMKALEAQEYGALDALIEIDDKEIDIYRIALVNLNYDTGYFEPRVSWWETSEGLLEEVIKELKDRGFSSLGHPRNQLSYAVFKNDNNLKIAFEKFIKEIKDVDKDCIVKTILDFYSSGDKLPSLDKYLFNSAAIDYPC